MYPHLFSEGTIGSLTVRNRTVMTAMGNAMASTDGSITDAAVAFYAERARGGCGLIITECLVVNWDNGRSNLHQSSVATDDTIAGLARLSARVHEAGAALVGQIYHPGRQGAPELNGVDSMPAPSDLVDALTQHPVHAMTLEEIAALIEDFGQAARRLKEAGFDGVEVHGAHGYLLTSFLSPYANLRTDAYGGDTEGRTRIVREIIARIRETCGQDFPLLVRISADEFLDMVGKDGQGIVLEEGVRIARALEAAGADAIDVSSGIYETMNSAWEPFPFEEGWKSHLAAAVKEAVSIPVIGVSVIRNPAFAERLLAEGKLDFVGSARAHFADPGWALKAQTDQVGAIRRCISCLACMESLVAADETGGPAICAINPRTGFELTVEPRDGEGKLIVVVGAGPAGLEAAVTAAGRGCKVVLLEADTRIGGQLNLAAQPPGKAKMNWVMEFYGNRIEALGIDLRLNTTATPALLTELAPDAVIVAAGSVPVAPRTIPGLDQNNVYLPPAVLLGEVDLSGKRVCVIGSGMTGIETTEFLAEQGCELALYEMAPDIGPGVYFQNMMYIMPRLGAHGTQFLPSHKLLGIEGQIARFEREDGSEVSARFDAFVVSLGTRPNSESIAPIIDACPNAVLVGDATKPGRVTNATADGWAAARTLAL
jgi:2,4-dienoyl-CoA reductase-like NADH-dependent reductase (Old Yellow Enzyme family)/thioredoxin reductase